MYLRGRDIACLDILRIAPRISITNGGEQLLTFPETRFLPGSSRYRIQLSHSAIPYRSERKTTRDTCRVSFDPVLGARHVPASARVQAEERKDRSRLREYPPPLLSAPLSALLFDNKLRGAELPFKRRVSYMIPEMATVQAH